MANGACQRQGKMWLKIRTSFILYIHCTESMIEIMWRHRVCGCSFKNSSLFNTEDMAYWTDIIIQWAYLWVSDSHWFLFFRAQRAETILGVIFEYSVSPVKTSLSGVHGEPHSPVQQQEEVSNFIALKELQAVNSAAEIARSFHIEVGTWEQNRLHRGNLLFTSVALSGPKATLSDTIKFAAPAACAVVCVFASGGLNYHRAHSWWPA